MIDALENQEGSENTPFGEYEEEAIVALLIEHPEFFSNIIPHLKDSLFKRIEVKYVVQHILDYFGDYNVFPTRKILRDIVAKHLTVDHPNYEEVIELIDRECDPREAPAVKASLIQWAKHRAYQILYNPDTIKRFNEGDFAYVDEVIEQARRIQEVGAKSFWFYDELEKIFFEEDGQEFTTGFDMLDKFIHDGSGPKRKEMLVWMAPTGVGKSIALVNNAIMNSKRGKKVAFFTFELSDALSGRRALGALTEHPVNKKEKRIANKDKMIKIAKALRDNGAGDIAIQEFPPDEVSVDAIYATLDQWKRERGWVPDIVILDYLELMLSRRESDNKDGYTRQKAVSTQVRGLAKNTNTLVFTATQTNRGGNDSTEMIDVTKLAESYGKAMPMDYLVSINQTEEEYRQARETDIATARLYVAKNRNGLKFVSIDIRINYDTNKMKQVM